VTGPIPWYRQRGAWIRRAPTAKRKPGREHGCLARTDLHRLHLFERPTGRAVRDVRARELERSPAVVAAAGVELRSMVGEGKRVSGKKLIATWQTERAVGDHDRNTLQLRPDPQGDATRLEPGMTVWIAR
jgi:hypothetical protein